MTASQASGDPGIMSLRKAVEESDTVTTVTPQASRAQRSRIMANLQDKISRGEATKEDFFNFTEQTFRDRAARAQGALQRAAKSDNPRAYQQQAADLIKGAYKEARDSETQIWKQLPEGPKVAPSKTINAYKEEVESITRGGEMSEIDSMIQKKLGEVTPTGKIKGGQLINTKQTTATPKELHQFYSVLGRRVRALSDQGGEANRIRILNRMRQSVLDDIESSGAGEDYQEALAFSKRLNEKFTEGDMGKILGFKRGKATPDTQVLDELLGSGGDRGRLNIKQALDAAPNAEDDMKNYLRARFAQSAAPEGAVNSQAGERFMKNNDKLLETFPEVKRDLREAIDQQKGVDELAGAGQTTELSPVVKEKSAAANYLKGENPDNAIDTVLFTGKKENLTKNLKDLRKLTNEDPTGYAQAGLKDSIVQRLIKRSELGADDPVTGEKMVSGRRFTSMLGDIRRPLKESGTMSEKELNRLGRIGRAFEQVEKERWAPAATSITADKPGYVMNILARSIGAGLGGILGKKTGGTTGGSLMYAQEGSALAQRIANNLVHDEAKDLLTKAVQDESTMNRLLQKATQMSDEQQMDWIQWAKTKVGQGVKEGAKAGARAPGQAARRTPAGAVAPAAVSVGQHQAQEDIDAELESLVGNMQNKTGTEGDTVEEQVESLEKKLFGED